MMGKQGKSMVTPRLRFPEFRNSEGWSTEPMVALYSFVRNNALSRDKLNYECGVAKNIHYGDIHTKFPALFDITRERVPYINDNEDVPDAGSEDYCVEGDLIFADASEDTNDVGKSMEIIRLNGEQLLSGQHTILARRKDDVIALGFGGYLFRSGYVRLQIKREAQGTKVYSISPSRLGSVQVAYPSEKAEQQKIADCLTSLDEVIVAQGRKVEALKAHKRGLMQQLFPREGETRPGLRFPEFRDAPEWANKPLGETATFYNGRAYAKEDLLERGKYRVLRVGNFFTNDHWYFSNLELEDTKYCDNGDLLYAWSASFGPRMWRDGKTIYHYHIWKVVENEGVDRKFLFYRLDSDTERMRARSANGIGMFHITKGTIENWISDFPALGEQQRIADCLSSLDIQITAESDKLAALKTHKQGLMQQLFPALETASA